MRGEKVCNFGIFLANFRISWVGNPQISPSNMKFSTAEATFGPLRPTKVHVNP